MNERDELLIEACSALSAKMCQAQEAPMPFADLGECKIFHSLMFIQRADLMSKRELDETCKWCMVE